MNKNPYKWYAAGDINAFFGLMLDNIAGLVLTVSLLSTFFKFPVDFALRYMVPGTAIGVLVGDLLFFVLAFRVAKKTGSDSVTAMPLGLDTPSTIGMVFFVLGPAFVAAQASGLDVDAAAMKTWHIGICAIVVTGVVKLVLSLGSNWIRRVFPRAGLLGSLAAIALVLIAFTQMPKIASSPIVGFGALAIVLVTLVARGKLPFKIPGALGAVAIGSALFYLLLGVDSLSEWIPIGTQLAPSRGEGFDLVWFPSQWFTVFSFSWFSAMPDALGYLPYIIPFALATVIGGIDCAESAASVGDEFNTRTVIGIEAIATLVAGLCGGVIQTTPYIGHPAYKAMGGRAAYTLATALFVGGAGLIGYFSLLFQWIPEAAVLPILVFIGIEITAQSFHATPRRHYAALAIACIPAMAKLITIYLGQFLGWFADVAPEKMAKMPDTLKSLSLYLNVLAGGFILTSLIWASALARIIDRRFFSATIYFAVGGCLVLFGIMHSPLVGDKMFLPTDIHAVDFRITEIASGESADDGVEANVGDVVSTNGLERLRQQSSGSVGAEPVPRFSESEKKITTNFVLAYLTMALLMFGLGIMLKNKTKIITTDEEFEKIT